MPDFPRLTGLSEAAKKLFGDAWRAKTGAVDEAIPYSILAQLGAVARMLTPDTKDGKTETAAMTADELISSAMKGLEKTKVPAWAAAPVVLVLVVISISRMLITEGDILAEKNISQGLRKKLRPSLLDPESAVQAEMRDLHDPAATAEILGRLGFKDADIAVLRGLAQYIPPAQDLVQFALREAYDDSIAAKFGMDDNLKAVLDATAEARKAAGLSEEDFKLYWRAHWDLPSVQQAFEMRFRGAIDDASLDVLLRAKDIMPFWRDALKKIAFSPLTRVDVRRMHKLGILDRAGVVKAFRDLGYDDANAEALTKFTEAYNRDPEESEKTEADKTAAKERDLTKGDVVALYKDGVLPADKAKTILGTLGYSADEQALYMDRADRQRDQVAVDDFVRSYRTLYIKGVVDKDAITEELQRIPLTAEHIKRLFVVWDLERFAAADMPSKAEVLRWMKKKLIGEDDARVLLANINVPEEFIDLHIKDTLG